MSSIEKPQTERPARPPDDARPSAADVVGERVLAGRYELLSQLARGGVGVVWRAKDLVLEREVAVKELRLPGDISDAERSSLVERTTQEARVAAQLAHRNLVEIFDVVNEDGRPWIVMELVRARTLDEIVSMAGPLPYQRVAEIGLQLIGALRHAHDHSIVHRDVKPENVMICEDGRVVLTDFGLATWTGESTLTTSGRIVGSPAYIPPERTKAGTLGPASDLWSLGATLYTAVEGHTPYDRKGYIAILRGDQLDDPPAARNAGTLAPVLEGLLHVDPDDRLSGDHAEKMLRIAVLASYAPAQSGPGDLETESAEGEADSDSSRESARAHFKAGANILSHAIQESLNDSVSSISGTVSSAFYRGSHERPQDAAMQPLLTSIRESTLGLTGPSGRHRTRRTLGPIAVALVVLILLVVMVLGLLLR